MAGEPAAGQVRHLAEGSRLLEQVTRAGNDGEPALAFQPRQGLLIEVEDYLVRAARDEQGRRTDHGQTAAYQVRAPAQGHDGRDRQPRRTRGGYQRGGRTGADPEVADRDGADVRLTTEPASDSCQAGREQGDVEHAGPAEFFARGEEVDQERAEAGPVQAGRHELVAPAAAAAVG